VVSYELENSSLEIEANRCVIIEVAAAQQRIATHSKVVPLIMSLLHHLLHHSLRFHHLLCHRPSNHLHW
jgi:hypothetical protein